MASSQAVVAYVKLKAIAGATSYRIEESASSCSRACASMSIHMAIVHLTENQFCSLPRWLPVEGTIISPFAKLCFPAPNTQFEVDRSGISMSNPFQYIAMLMLLDFYGSIAPESLRGTAGTPSALSSTKLVHLSPFRCRPQYIVSWPVSERCPCGFVDQLVFVSKQGGGVSPMQLRVLPLQCNEARAFISPK